MIRGLYTVASGMLMEQQKLDSISNNLANVNTTGFKKDIFTVVPFKEMLIKRLNDPSINSMSNPVQSIGTLTNGVCVSQIYTDYTQGSLEKTDNELDFGLNGAGFFAVKANSKNTQGNFYTRDGNFSLNNQGMLVTKDGYYVLGQNGPIKLNPNVSVKVSSNGNIYQNDKLVDKLQLTNFKDTTQLRKMGDNLVSATAQATKTPFTGEVEQGMLESSNVNTIKEMVNMINTMRTFEADQRVITTEDGTLDKAVNDVGTVR